MEIRIETAVAEIHRHTNSNDLTNIKSTIANNMNTVQAHMTSTDEALIQIRKNIAEHIECLVDKIHDQYMTPEHPFMNSDPQHRDDPMDTTQMGAQPTQTPRPYSNATYKPQSPSPEVIRKTNMNDCRVELG